MSPLHETERARPQYFRLLRGPLILLALVIIVRFVLEAARVPLDTTRFFSASVVSGLVIIYLALWPHCAASRDSGSLLFRQSL